MAVTDRQATPLPGRPPSVPVRQLGAIVCLLGLGCGKPAAPKPVPPAAQPVVVAPFHDAAEAAGLDFRHDNGMTGKRYILEIMAPGSALLDYDRDGDLDVFLVQGRSLEGEERTAAESQTGHRLFRNDLTTDGDGRPVLRFTDVSEAAGLSFSDYGMGAIAGDYDRDGHVDLYVTCYGHDRLLRNDGQGRFVDVTEAAGLTAAAAWSTSASWADYDRDGDLDLFVCQYLEWTFETHVVCPLRWGPGYCAPQSFPPSRSRLYRNQGDGTFTNVSESSGISELAGAALGVVAADLNDDGWVDFFVANDAMPNHLWINRRDGTFSEEALARGCAVNGYGAAEGNMGIVAADFYNLGRIDLLITHLKDERATLYHNLGEGQFVDVTGGAGLTVPTSPYTGFGAGAIDYDNDGFLDVFATNGGVQIEPHQVKAGLALPLRHPSLLLRNQGQTAPRFESVQGFPFLSVEDVGRGAAFGDLDNDGDADVIVNNNHGPVRLLLNDVGQGKHWLGLRLVTGPATPGTPQVEWDAIGAVARLERPDRPTLSRRCATDGSYLTSSDPRLLFGLGDSPDTGTIRVRWPDGAEEVWENLPCDCYHVLRQRRFSGASELD